MKPNKPVQRILNKNRLTGKKTMKPNKQKTEWEKEFWKNVTEYNIEDIKSETIYLVTDDNVKNFISQLLKTQRETLIKEIIQEIEYSIAHHEVVFDNWSEEPKDVFKNKLEVKGFLMALYSLKEDLSVLKNK